MAVFERLPAILFARGFLPAEIFVKVISCHFRVIYFWFQELRSECKQFTMYYWTLWAIVLWVWWLFENQGWPIWPFDFLAWVDLFFDCYFWYVRHIVFALFGAFSGILGALKANLGFACLFRRHCLIFSCFSWLCPIIFTVAQMSDLPAPESSGPFPRLLGFFLDILTYTMKVCFT